MSRCGPTDEGKEAQKWLAACADALVQRDDARAERDLAYSVLNAAQYTTPGRVVILTGDLDPEQQQLVEEAVPHSNE